MPDASVLGFRADVDVFQANHPWPGLLRTMSFASSVVTLMRILCMWDQLSMINSESCSSNSGEHSLCLPRRSCSSVHSFSSRSRRHGAKRRRSRCHSRDCSAPAFPDHNISMKNTHTHQQIKTTVAAISWTNCRFVFTRSNPQSSSWGCSIHSYLVRSKAATTGHIRYHSIQLPLLRRCGAHQRWPPRGAPWRRHQTPAVPDQVRARARGAQAQLARRAAARCK